MVSRLCLDTCSKPNPDWLVVMEFVDAAIGREGVAAREMSDKRADEATTVAGTNRVSGSVQLGPAATTAALRLCRIALTS